MGNSSETGRGNANNLRNSSKSIDPPSSPTSAPTKPAQCLPLDQFKGSQKYPLNPIGPENRSEIERWDGRTKELILVTYNVWFEDHHLEERFKALCNILIETNADIICLQEVTPKFLKLLRKEEWIKKYSILDPVGEDPYGVCLLSKIPIKSQGVWSLPTQMGRSCLLAEFDIDGKSFVCATVHLESLNLPQYRKEQLKIISNLSPFQNANTAILLGDFNFDSDINFSQHLEKRFQIEREKDKNPSEIEPPELPKDETLENKNIGEFYQGFKDVWPHLSEGEKGYTFDSILNKMLTNYEQMRYDRILLRSTYWKPHKIKLLGTKPVDETKPKIFPSDHFGLEMKLQKYPEGN